MEAILGYLRSTSSGMEEEEEEARDDEATAAESRETGNLANVVLSTQQKLLGGF